MKQIAALPQQTVADFLRVSNQINLSDFEQMLSLEKASALRAMLDPKTRRGVTVSIGSGNWFFTLLPVGISFARANEFLSKFEVKGVRQFQSIRPGLVTPKC